AITIYKLQGLSLDKAVIYVSSKRDYALGFIYITVFYVKLLDKLMFNKHFFLNYLKSSNLKTIKRQNADM
ncbi:uncharacterized protein BDR25DRAFT_244596, partial [Lindgomyces ingoldianus]